jgi:hypothetical protein
MPEGLPNIPAILVLSTDAAVQAGFAGMDPAKANEFFKYAYDAGLLLKTGLMHYTQRITPIKRPILQTCFWIKLRRKIYSSKDMMG